MHLKYICDWLVKHIKIETAQIPFNPCGCSALVQNNHLQTHWWTADICLIKYGFLMWCYHVHFWSFNILSEIYLFKMTIFGIQEFTIPEEPLYVEVIYGSSHLQFQSRVLYGTQKNVAKAVCCCYKLNKSAVKNVFWLLFDYFCLSHIHLISIIVYYIDTKKQKKRKKNIYIVQWTLKLFKDILHV